MTIDGGETVGTDSSCRGADFVFFMTFCFLQQELGLDLYMASAFILVCSFQVRDHREIEQNYVRTENNA